MNLASDSSICHYILCSELEPCLLLHYELDANGSLVVVTVDRQNEMLQK